MKNNVYVYSDKNWVLIHRTWTDSTQINDRQMLLSSIRISVG